MNSNGVRIVSCLLSVVTVILSSTFYLCYGESLATEAIREYQTTKKPQDISVIETVGKVVYEVKNTISQQTTKSTEKSQNTTSATKKKGKKIGNIVSQFLSPYNANTSYNNIYLNNQSGVKINIKKLIEGYKSNVDVKSQKPQVLIIHTHATENYQTHSENYYTESDLNRTKNEKQSVIGVGNKITEILKKNGIAVIHDKTLHDNPSYSGSYTRSAATVEKYLKKYPSIKVVLDVHRDAIGSGKNIVKPVTEIKGKKAAQVMICVGSETGVVDYFPKWKENLTFGLKLQQTMEVMYPGLSRALYLSYEHCYNQNLSTGSIIIEFGTNGNTFEEAEYSATLVANSLVTLFSQSS